MVNIINMLRKPKPLVPYEYPRARRMVSLKEQEKIVSKLKEPLLEHRMTDFFGRVDKTMATKMKEGPGKVFVVMSGAGQRFWAYLGFLHALDKHNIPISAYIGTSGGALAGMLAALEYDYEEVIKKLDGHMEYLFYDFDFSALLKLKNVCRGERIREYIRKSLSRPSLDFSNGLDFYVVATAINIYEKVGSSFAYRRFAPVVFGKGFTENFPVADGLYASICLPNFEPIVAEENIRFYGVNESGKKVEYISGNKEVGLTYLVDGGYTSHKPVEVAVHLYNPEEDMIILLTPTGDFKPEKVNLINSFFTLPLSIDIESEFSRKMKNFENENIMVVYIQDWVSGEYDITNVRPNDFSKIRMLYDAGKEAAIRWLYHYYGISLFI
jgi:predicted acylesterase/phospholipase RssA